MATVLDREIERAVEHRLTPGPRRQPPAAPSRAPAHPAVRFSPLLGEPAPAARRRRLFLLWVSVATHVVVVAIVMLMPERAQTVDEPSLPIEIVFTAPLPSLPERLLPPSLPKPVAKPAPKPEPKPVPRDEPKPVALAPKPEPPPFVREIEAAPVAKVEPPRPRPAVRTGLLDEVAASPAIVASRNSRSAIVATGFDGTPGAATTSARQGRVVEAAFDTEPAKQKDAHRGDGVVQDSGFGVEAAAPTKPKAERERPLSALDTEVEILSKPKPVYTDEARGLRLEGDVVLDVVFEAGGVLRVLGVAQGLGHGLDEAAIDAARKIRFNPARRDGAPVDHAAKLRVVFRLA
jgi:TonB family protein